MMRFSALTIFSQPALHLWKEGTEFVTDLRAVSVADTGWAEFEYTGAERSTSGHGSCSSTAERRAAATCRTAMRMRRISAA
jgi:hypothetical protein